MRYCSKCGNEVDEDDNFSPNCGAVVTKADIIDIKAEIKRRVIENLVKKEY